MKFTLLLAAIAMVLASVSAFMAPSAFAGSRLATRAAAVPSAGPVMRTRNCDLTGKSANRKARVVTFSHTRIHKVQMVNLHTKKIFSPTLKRNVTMRLCTSALRTIKKYGLEKAAKVYDCDLSKF